MVSGTDSSRPRTVVIGVGNEIRGDDAAGLIVVRRLREISGISAVLLEQSGEGAALIESMKGVDTLFVVDAAQSGAAPGTIHYIEAHAQKLPGGLFHYSTHAFSVAEAIETARALGELPKSVFVYGIEGKAFGYGATVSVEVADAIEHLVRVIAAKLVSESADQS